MSRSVEMTRYQAEIIVDLIDNFIDDALMDDLSMEIKVLFGMVREPMPPTQEPPND